MKSVLAVFIGLILSVLVVVGMELVGQQWFPAPEDLDPTNKEQLKRYFSEISILALIWVIFSHFTALFLGNLIALKISKGHRQVLYAISGIFLFMIGLNIVMLVYPIWFIIIDIIAVVLAVISPLKLVKNRKN